MNKITRNQRPCRAGKPFYEVFFFYLKGMILKGKVGAEEKIYRVLDLKEKVLVLDCVKKIMPVWKTYEELSDYVEKRKKAWQK